MRVTANVAGGGLSYIALAVIAAGCGSAHDGMTPVAGKVTWNGQPVTHGTVIFYPKSSTQQDSRRLATGRIQPDGSFRMSTFEFGDGVREGRYLVAIDTTEPNSTEDTSDMAVRTLLPAAYAAPDTSGLAVDVNSMKTQYDFALVPSDDWPSQ